MRAARFSILLAVSVLLSGCAFLLHPIDSTFARHSNPIADWTFRPFDEYSPPRDQHHYELSKAITDDYQQFIADKKFPYPPDTITGFFDDGKGKRAVQISIPLKGVSRFFVLVYDRYDKRIKVIEWSGGYYMCKAPWPNQSAAAPNRRPAGQSDGSNNLPVIVAVDRPFPTAVVELDRQA